MRFSSVFLAVTIAVSVSACSQHKAAPTPEQAQLQAIMLASAGGADASAIPAFQPRAARGPEEVAPGNLLHLSCLEDEKIKGDFRVEFDGSIKLPYDVKLTAAGLSLTELRTALREHYRSFFKTAPDFEVSFADRKVWVRAQGLVTKPGQYLVSPEGSIDDVVGEAGGLLRSADQETARFVRIVDGQYRAALKLTDYYSGSVSAPPIWRGGETVFFQNEGDGIGDLLGVNRKYVQVMGQVRTPGEYIFRENANIFYYLVQAGGPTDRANMENVVVVRADGSKVQAIPFSVSDPGSAPSIKGGDIVLLQAEGRSNLERDTSIFGNVGGFMSALAATVLVASGL